MDEDLIRILPIGASDRLVDIPLVDGDLDPDLHITNFYQTSIRAVPAFVGQIDAHVDQTAETFGPNGEPGVTYTIKEVNEAEDTITLLDETGAEKKIEFNFIGIPRDEGFDVLRPRQNETENANNPIAEQLEEETEEIDIFEDVTGEVETGGLVERPLIQRIYPDNVQRNDMFQNLLEMLEPASQKNPKRQKAIRQLVEQFLMLRNEVVHYGENGEPEGKVITSYQTIAELIERADIPVLRPVLEASRTMYFDIDKGGDNPTEIPGVAVDILYSPTVTNESNEFLDTQMGGTTGQLIIPDALPHWFVAWETFFKRYMRSWLSEGDAGASMTFREDKEFLRAPLSDGLEEMVDGLPHFGEGGSVKEVRKIPDPRIFKVNASFLNKVQLSLIKGLGPRKIRTRDRDPPRRIESGDEGIVMSQLLFPLHTQRDLGTIRSGSLMKDIALGMGEARSMATILTNMGGIPEVAIAGGVISIGENGNSTGNIAIEDWIRLQPLKIFGLGDALVELKNLGMTQVELSVDQQDVLVAKINQIRAIIKQHITTERADSVKEVAELRLENLPFLQGEALEELFITLQSEPLINTRIEEIRNRIPAYKENDLALVGGIMSKLSDLFLAVMAGVPGPLARERNRCVRNQFLEALRQALLKAEKKANIGEIPQPVQCPHVESLDIIRMVKDDDERIQLISRLLARFRGPTKGDWITCSAAPHKHPHNLLCYHEFLQIQEYLHPREKDTLHKELLLKYSGGVFQGRFVCKNCGQFISEMEFDTSMEFDDNGRPMANRAALVDAAGIAEDELNAVLGTANEEVAFASEMQTLIYTNARQLFDALGIYAGTDAFKQIVERVDSDIQRQPSREEYAKIYKAKKEKAIDYDIFIHRLLASSLAAHSLIEIQTHAPEYVIRYKIPGCVAGFTGFPMGKADDKTGVNYVVCALATLKSAELADFNRMPADKRGDFVVKLIGDAMKTANVQRLVSVKQAYNERVYGKTTMGEGIPEKVPAGFRPTPYFVTKEEASQAIVVPEAAGPQELVRAWIQTGHRIARENGTFIRGSPFSETSCCYRPVADPRHFWGEKEATLPVLPPKAVPRGQAASQVTLRFTPRRPARLLADPPEDLFYRVFLRVCYDGPRKGLPHEPEFTNNCPHCAFVFPENPYITLAGPPLTNDLYKEWRADMDAIITKGKSALESQKVIINRGTFENVLDAAHKRFRVEVPAIQKPENGTALLTRIARLEPEPFEGCRRLLAEVITRAAGMPPGAQEMDIATVYAPLFENKETILGGLGKRIGFPLTESLENLFKQSPTQIVESIRAYFLVPFQRLLLKFEPKSFKIQRSYDLPPDITKSAEAALQQHLEYLNKIKKDVKGYTEIKLRQAQMQLSVLLNMIQAEVRPKLIPGGIQGTMYLVSSLVIGVLGELVNPNVIPDGVTATGGAVEITARVPQKILEICISRLQAEGLNYTDDQIRDKIALRTAAEKDLFTTRQNKMTPEQKKADMMMKRLGLGTWAVGGTKGVYMLSDEQADREREQREQMNLGNYGLDPDAAAQAGTMLDEYFGGGGEGAEAGYDDYQDTSDNI